MQRKISEKYAPRLVLGVHDGHNATAALLSEGKMLDVLQEERVRGVKNIGGFPESALEDVVKRNQIPYGNMKVVYDGTYVNYGSFSKENIINEYERCKTIGASLKALLKRNKHIFSLYKVYKNQDRIKIFKKLFAQIKAEEIETVEHHTAHAAAAYYGWGKEGKNLILTCDGSGDGLCATVNIGGEGKFERIAQVTEDNSIGRLYAYISYAMGMMPLEHEYKIMGLAPYGGVSRDVERLYKRFSSIFEFEKGLHGITWKRNNNVPSMYAPRYFINRLIYRERFDWIAAGLQIFIERFLKQWVSNCIKAVGIKKVALSGGVFMNVKANKAIYEIPEVEELFVFPSCGDESNSIGAAYYAFIKGGGNVEALKAIYFGADISDEDVEYAIEQHTFKGKRQIKYMENIEKAVAELLAKGEVIGRIKGKMEFGARALGNRSILANASNHNIIKIINEMIKRRDFWMPFAPSVLAEASERYFIKPKPLLSPYMMFTFDTKAEKREKIIATLHPHDYTARPQEVIEDWNPEYYRLIKYYEDITGEPIILNTSYNLHGYPIVYNPSDALEVFDNSGLQYLALGNYLLKK